MNIKACPRCGSRNVILHAAGITGNYKCLDCGYIGPLIMESDERLRIKKSNSNVAK